MCFGRPLNLVSRTLAKPQKPSMPLIWTGPFANSSRAWIDADVAIPEVDQAMVAAPAIGVDDGAWVDPAADDALERRLRAVLDDLGIDAALPLEDAEDDRLAVGAAPTPALDSTRPEEALVDLDDPKQGALGFAGQPHAFPHAPVEPVHGVAVQPTQRRCLQSRQIGGDVAHDLTDLGLRNP